MSKILIISNSYPNYGGQSTTAYNLLKLLKQHGFDAKALYINDAKHAEIDPEKTGASHKILMRKSILHKIYRWQRKNKGIALDKHASVARNYYFLLRLIPKLLHFLFSKKYSPTLIITNIPAYYWLLNKIFGKRKIMLIIGSSPEMNKLAKHRIDASMVLNRSEKAMSLLSKAYKPDYSKAIALFNSPLTQKIYESFNINTGKSIIQYFNLLPLEIRDIPEFNDRKYDIAFIASDFSRDIKNVPLADKIFNAFPDKLKIAIGKGSNGFANIENTEVRNLSKQAEIIQLFSQTKLLIIPSFFDSSPSVLSEAILSGCNVLVSKNVGWNEMLNKESVVDNFYDLDEWLAKATFLLNRKISYLDFEKIVTNSRQEIVKQIKDILQDDAK